jgi:hypothetical protein
MFLEGSSVARTPKPWYSRGAWRTDFGGERNHVLIASPKNAETRLQAEKELLKLHEESGLLRGNPGMETPFAVVVERFLAEYEDRPVYVDFSNELHWFMVLIPRNVSIPSTRRISVARINPRAGVSASPAIAGRSVVSMPSSWRSTCAGARRPGCAAFTLSLPCAR